jgi:hypothetical protein
LFSATFTDTGPFRFDIATGFSLLHFRCIELVADRRPLRRRRFTPGLAISLLRFDFFIFHAGGH